MFQPIAFITLFHSLPFPKVALLTCGTCSTCSKPSFQANPPINPDALAGFRSRLGVAKRRNRSSQISAERGGIARLPPLLLAPALPRVEKDKAFNLAARPYLASFPDKCADWACQVR